VVLQSVRSLIVRRFQVSQICLMAAAVDDSSLAHPAVYLEAAAKTGRIAVLASRRDRILKFGYPLGDFLKAFLSPRDRPGAALGYHGPRAAATDPIPNNVCHAQISDSLGVNHGDYVPGTAPSVKELSACRFAGAVLGGVERPAYT